MTDTIPIRNPHDPPDVDRDPAWIALGAWGSIEATGETRDEVIAEIAADHSYTDHRDMIWLCPVSLAAIAAGECHRDASERLNPDECPVQGEHDDDCPAGHDDDCGGECWADGDEVPAGCGRTIIDMSALRLVPIQVADRIGWAAADWHDHNPGPGGKPDIPSSHSGEFGGYACGAWDCGGVTGAASLVAVAAERCDMSDDEWTHTTRDWDRIGRQIAADVADRLDAMTNLP